MFSTATNGSKIALSFLVHRLNTAGFTLFDAQFITPHLHSLGAIEIPRSQYKANLKSALRVMADFTEPATPSASQLLKDHQRLSDR